jgi:hypothetical protein
MTAPNLTSTLTIRGRDEASAELRKVTDSAGGLSDRLRDATASGSGLSDSLRSIVSGDISGGLSGLAEALGVSGVAAGALSAAAGIGATAAAIGAASVKTTEWSMQIELLRARMDTAFTGGSAEAFAIADAVGVSVAAVVELQTSLRASGAEGEITVSQLRAMTDAAMALGKDGDEALTAFAAALRTGATDGLANVGVMVRGKHVIAEYAEALGKSTAELSVAERAQAVLMATQEAANRAVGAGSEVLGRQDDALDALGNRWEQLKQVLSALVAGPAARMVESLVAIATAVRDAIPVVLALGRVAIAPVVQIFNALSAAVEANAAALRGDFAAAAKLAGKALSSALAPEDAIGNIRRVMEEVDAFGASSRQAAQYTAASGTAAQATSGQIGGLAVAFDMFAQAADKAVKTQAKFTAAKPTSPAARRRAAPTPAGRGGDEQDKRARETADEWLRELQAAQAAAENEAARLQEAARQYDHYRDRVLGAYTEIATDPSRKAALEIQQIEIAAAREMAQVQEMMHLSAAQQAELSAAIQVQALERVRAKQVEVRQAVASQVQAWAGAGLAISQALGVGDAAARASAALQAIIAGADAFKYAAAGNIPGAIASGAAAIGYAKAALTPAPAAPSGAVAPAVRAAPTPAASGGGGQSHTTIHLHGIMTTRAEVGVGVAKAMKAAKATGYLPQGVPA